MAGDFPCVSTFCLWALLALTWLHRLPALSSMWEIIRHWAVVLLIFTGHLHTHYSWQARRAAGWTWGTISAGDSCLSLPSSPFSDHVCCCLLHLADFLPVGHSARLNRTAQCFSVLPCLLSSLAACPRTEFCLRLTASGRRSSRQPAHSQCEQQSNSTSSCWGIWCFLLYCRSEKTH